MVFTNDVVAVGPSHIESLSAFCYCACCGTFYCARHPADGRHHPNKNVVSKDETTREWVLQCIMRRSITFFVSIMEKIKSKKKCSGGFA
jgi:hypothetical protein